MRTARTTAVLLSLLVVASTVACSGASTPPPAAPVAPALAAPPITPTPVARSLAEVGLDASALDRSVAPCDDFYQFACGGWLAATEIPADRSRWSRSFSVIDDKNEQALKKILDEAAAAPASDAASAKLAAYYGACMDEAGIETAGFAAIDPLVAAIAKVKDAASLGAAITQLHRVGLHPLFSLDAEQDFKDARRVIAYLDQAGLGMPDRDYYLEAKFETQRKAYVAHVERMFALLLRAPKVARAAAEDVLRIETALAKISKSQTERRDPAGLYNLVDRAALTKLAPAFDWAAYFTSMGRGDLTEASVTSLPFFAGLSVLLGAEQPKAWRNYLSWQLAHGLAMSGPKRFVDEAFALSQALTGQPKLEDRWKRCISATDEALGELLAQPYVARHFAGAARSDAEEMVKQIGAAFGRQLEGLAWMDDATRTKAKEKLAGMNFKIGYPNAWRAYDFAVAPKGHLANLLTSRAFEVQRDLAKMGKPVDRAEWGMSPPTVNAYYNPLLNEMVFPAGILQPPFYDPRFSVAVNLGGMGMVVGHELTHGFDDEGSQFAADGNLTAWWTPEVRTRFDEKTSCVAAQYERYEPLPGLKLNGKLTLGENIADLGGVKLAFAAYRTMRAGATDPIIAEGFTEDQLFFLGVGQAWCSKSREEMTRQLVQRDPHSPAEFRVRGPLVNLGEFATAFSCPAESPMSPKDRCDVW